MKRYIISKNSEPFYSTNSLEDAIEMWQRISIKNITIPVSGLSYPVLSAYDEQGEDDYELYAPEYYPEFSK